MIKKYTRKAKVLTAILVAILGSAPAISHAGFFDWVGNYGDGYISYSNFALSQPNFLYANADSNQDGSELDNFFPAIFQSNSLGQVSSVITPTTPKVVAKIPVGSKVRVVQASAYSSTPDQTDSSPFITAKGTRVRDGIIAANFLPFNTLVRIPEIFGDKVFVVEDRMNSRYSNHIDIWFPDRQSALEFGRRTVTIEIAGTI